jgi:hypothetical protein
VATLTLKGETKLLPFSCTVRVIELTRMSWAGHEECMGKKIKYHRVLVGKPEGRKETNKRR